MDLSKELLKWAEANPECYEYGFVCVFCRATENQKHKADCMYMKAILGSETPKVAYCPTCGTALGIGEDLAG